MLNDLLAGTQQIMGTNANNEINFENLNNMAARGAYSRGRITINSQQLDAGNYDVLRTVVHEVRHAYQQDSTKPFSSNTVSKETKKQWKSPYVSPDPQNMAPYLSQPVEWDARRFAGQPDSMDGLTPVYPGSW